MRGVAVILGFGLAVACWACSGPTTQVSILQNHAVTLGAAGLSFLLAVLALMRRLAAARIVCLLLLAMHPAWTISDCCDCGSMQVSAAVLVAVISFAAFVWDRNRKRTG